MHEKSKSKFSHAVTVIILFGIISMLGDVVYESARSANSQYLNLLGISAAKVGLVFGIGEFIGYFLRLIAGILSDKSGKHWMFVFFGYGMLIVVPLIGFTANWNILIILILLERIGKSLRSPAKDTVLSGVSENQVGIGFAFGLQEALDQIGAFAGPLIFTIVFYLTGKTGIFQYQSGYKLLIIPYILLMLFLSYVYFSINKNHLIEHVDKKEFKSEKLQPIFWAYTLFTFFCTLGFINFSIIGYHIKSKNLMTDGNITLLYAAAMIIDAIAALLVGKTYDHIKNKTGLKSSGLLMLLGIPIVSFLIPLLTLSNSNFLIIIGMIFFGIILGTHETIMRSAIADITPLYKRGTGYGVFNTAYGLALLFGSSLMGWLYDLNKISLIFVFALVSEAISILIYFYMNKLIK